MSAGIVVRGRPVEYEHRPGAGPARILLHGAGGNHHGWAPLLDAMDGVEAVAPSLPGRVGSDGPPLETVSEMAAWTLALVEALGLDRPILVGHSLGGAIALEAGLQSMRADGPSLGGLVLLATGARLRVHPAILELARQAAQAGTPMPLDRSVWRPDAADALIEGAERVRAMTPAATTLVDWHAANGFDRMADLGRIDLPALVVGGTEDVLTPPKYARYLAEHLPQGRLVELEDAGHMLPFERCTDVAAWLR